MTGSRRTVLAALGFCFVLLPQVASAQSVNAILHHWLVAGDIGVMSPTNPQSGSGTLPAPGATFETFDGKTSRQESTFLAADGAVLANGALAAVNRPTFSSIDSMLIHRSMNLGSGISGGLRVERQWTPTVSFRFDWTAHKSPRRSPT